MCSGPWQREPDPAGSFWPHRSVLYDSSLEAMVCTIAVSMSYEKGEGGVKPKQAVSVCDCVIRRPRRTDCVSRVEHMHSMRPKLVVSAQFKFHSVMKMTGTDEKEA